MINFAWAKKYEGVYNEAANRFCSAHPEEGWNISALEAQDGVRITVSSDRAPYAQKFTVAPRGDGMSDSIFEALEANRTRSN
jgi:hypothetical protein